MAAESDHLREPPARLNFSAPYGLSPENLPCVQINLAERRTFRAATRGTLRARPCPQPLHVVRQPRVADHFVGLASVLGGTQAGGPLGLAISEQAVLPVGGLLVTVGPFRKLAEKASGRDPQDLRGCLLEGPAGLAR